MEKLLLLCLLTFNLLAGEGFVFGNEKINSVRDADRGNTVKPAITDGNGNPLSSYYDTATNKYVLNIHDADVHNVLINEYFHRHTDINTTLTSATDINGTTYILDVNGTTGFVVGDYVQVGAENHTGIKYRILDLNTTNMTLDSYVDTEYPIGTLIRETEIDMNVSGTLASPQEFIIKPNAGQVIHITSINLTMTHGSPGDLGLFGDLAALTNGVLIRFYAGGQLRTYTNWRTNGDIKDDVHEVEFDVRTGGGGGG